MVLGAALTIQMLGCSSAPEPVEQEEVPATEEAALESEVLPVEDSPILGDPQAPVTVMEFSSMTCPFCGQADLVLKDLMEHYDGEIRVVFKHFPLNPQAESASLVLEATRLQDEEAFWEMKTALFARIHEFGTRPMEDIGVELAEEMGLDGEQLRRDVGNPELNQVVAHDFQMGRQLGVTGTPQFFVNGEAVAGAQPVENFAAIVDEQLELVDELLESGVSEEEVYEEAVRHNLGIDAIY